MILADGMKAERPVVERLDEAIADRQRADSRGDPCRIVCDSAKPRFNKGLLVKLVGMSSGVSCAIEAAQANFFETRDELQISKALVDPAEHPGRCAVGRPDFGTLERGPCFGPARGLRRPGHFLQIFFGSPLP